MPTALRKIALRSPGQTHGPITRLISPGDIGEYTKPFIFLDYVDATQGPGFGFHPHSGIVTLTHPLTFDVEHEASSGQRDLVPRGGVEWVVTGGGIWHRASLKSGARAQGFQLWFALPPSHENGEAHARFIPPESVPSAGPVTVLLGRYETAHSTIEPPFDAHCFVVRLAAGETWTYTPPSTHTVAWGFVQQGRLRVQGESVGKELFVLEEGSGPLTFEAEEGVTLLLGSAAKHPYPLTLGRYSVHTNAQALAQGEARIQAIGQQLAREGRLD